ncbi:MAG: fibronectin, partial [Calditrichota bacterium]
WGDESEAAPDFAGYRVYRAIGNPGTVVQEDKLVGTWEKVFECGEGTGQSLTHVFEDAQAQRGQGYYYYVSAFDDGQGNTGVDGKDVGVLETGPYRNRTTRSASLTRAPGELLSEIRVVPNPFHISASDVQFTGEPNKIIFMGLPPEATIKIYSESGDLVQVIEHTDGSGDEAWGDIFEEQQVTRSGQVIVSGVYIALIQTPSGESTYVKFAIVR